MKPIGALYLGYLFYFSSIFGLRSIGMFWNYLMNIFFIVILFVFLLVSNRKVNIGSNWMIVFSMIIISLLGLLFNEQYFTFLLVLKGIILVYFLIHFRIREVELIRFINSTYLFYVFISILFYLFLPGVIYSLKEGQNNLMNIGGLTIRMLQSIEGSASSLDTYSSVVLVLNLSFSKLLKNWKFYVLLSGIVLLWTFRLTPMFGLLVAFVGSVFVRSGKTSFLFLTIMVFSPFLLSLYFYQTNIVYKSLPIQVVLNGLTHNRSMIWNQQLQILLNNYNIMDYIYGNFSSELFSVQAYQMDGSLRRGYFIDNPHNTYLYLFFRGPLLFVMVLLMVLRRLRVEHDSRWWPVILVIFVGALTNGQLLTLQNPIPLIILIFYLVKCSKLRYSYAF